MLQELINWIFGKNIELNDNLKDKNAAIIIENAYLNYKSKQRIYNNLENIINNLVQDIYTKPVQL